MKASCGTAGPRMTMNSAGNIRKMRGNSILIGACRAFSSARWRRMSGFGKPVLPPWKRKGKPPAGRRLYGLGAKTSPVSPHCAGALLGRISARAFSRIAPFSIYVG